jgi:hypothetical protein
MGWMKYVELLRQERASYIPHLKAAIEKAKQHNLNYVVFNGEVITISQAEGMLSILTDDQIHRETDIDV